MSEEEFDDIIDEKLNISDDINDEEQIISDDKYNIPDAMNILTNSYLGGLFDGDGSFVIHKLKNGGFQMLIHLSQSVTNILYCLKEKYGGYIYIGRKRENQRQQYSFRIAGLQATKLLTDLSDGCILKYHQAINCRSFLNLIGKLHMNDEKTELYNKNMSLNHGTLILDKPFNKINDDYIAGLFDSEGCLGITTKQSGKTEIYVQITQKNNPEILEKIKTYLGYGSTTRKNKYLIYSISDILKFLNIIEGKVIVKQYQLTYFKQFVQSKQKYPGLNISDKELKLRETWIDILKKDKHEDRVENEGKIIYPIIKKTLNITLKKH